MPLMAILLVIILVAMFGFWETLQAIAGGILIIVLLAVVAAALVAGIIYRMARGPGGRV